MKKIYKRLFAVMITLMLLLTAVPAYAKSDTIKVPTTLKLTLYSSRDTTSAMGPRNIGWLCKIRGKATKLASSNKSVATLSQSSSGGYSFLYVYPKKAGTTTVSFKVNSKTYKTKVTVRKYTNAISSVKIGKTTLSSSKFNTSSVCNLSYSKFANKKSTVTIKLKKGWKLVNGFCYSQKGWRKRSNFYKSGKAITVKGGKGFCIMFDVINQSTGQIEAYYIPFK